MKKLLVTIALGASFISTPAFSQAPAPTVTAPPPLVAPTQTPPGMMRNQTRAEAQQRTALLFQMLDANKDGTVTRAEADQAAAKFAASRGGDATNARPGGGRIQRMIDQAFATSQSLTLAQFESQSLARFDAADLNHDGTVTAAEREQARGTRTLNGQTAVPLPPQPQAQPQPQRQ